MIVWINGAFGAGKTTTARELIELIPNSTLFDPEVIGGTLTYLLAVEAPRRGRRLPGPGDLATARDRHGGRDGGRTRRCPRGSDDPAAPGVPRRDLRRPRRPPYPGTPCPPRPGRNDPAGADSRPGGAAGPPRRRDAGPPVVVRPHRALSRRPRRLAHRGRVPGRHQRPHPVRDRPADRRGRPHRHRTRLRHRADPRADLRDPRRGCAPLRRAGPGAARRPHLQGRMGVPRRRGRTRRGPRARRCTRGSGRDGAHARPGPPAPGRRLGTSRTARIRRAAAPLRRRPAGQHGGRPSAAARTRVARLAVRHRGGSGRSASARPLREAALGPAGARTRGAHYLEAGVPVG